MERFPNNSEEIKKIPAPGPSPVSIEKEGLSDSPITEEIISLEEAEKLKKLLEEEF